HKNISYYLMVYNKNCSYFGTFEIKPVDLKKIGD
ncbi:unnamed protein product, partial [marine sediment metagenome]